MTTESFIIITADVAYRPYRIPPRCRKARPVPESFTHHIDIPAVSSDDAPVVAIVPDDRGYLGTARGGDVPMRCFNGQLYTAVLDGENPVVAGSARFPAAVKHTSYENGSFEAMVEAKKQFDGILIVDGNVWKSAEEPHYTIMTMGLGGNHGGTYLELSFFDRGMAGRRFPVTEYDHAVDSAVEFAQKRGDTNSIRMIRETPKVTVLDPTAFKIPTEASRLAGAEDEVRALVAKAAGLLAGPVSRDSLRSVTKLVEEADSLFWQHGLDTVAPTL
ncbi:hypothetical protein ACFVTM_08870 [Arthrobacter sp. NPDC058130]|uniref:hypothetical protein n=1 Tax=Arthrobacter sp. NPDC058130 TaxID=3346353 RepID=UPI0036E7B323